MMTPREKILREGLERIEGNDFDDDTRGRVVGNELAVIACETLALADAVEESGGQGGWWIAVSERLPEVGVCVQVTQCGIEGHDLKEYESRLWKARLMKNGEWWTEDTMLPSRVHGVINWQPLPNPPEVKL